MSQLSCADDPDSLVALYMSDHQQPALICHANRDEPRFAIRMVGVRDRGGEEIAEHSGGLGERYAMLPEILGSFVRMPLEVHAHSVSVSVSAAAGPSHLLTHGWVRT
jgi:hypothetical protein